MADYDVIVIGAGLGGLSAGALLSAQGRKVLILEQSQRIGGCCSSFERDGFRFDVGASIVEIIKPIEDVFKKLGTTLQAEIDLIPCDPVMSVMHRDGSNLTIPFSLEKTGELIRSISTEDGRHWDDFVEFCAEMADISLDTFFEMPADSMLDMLKMVNRQPRLVKYLPVFLSSYQQILEHFFKDERVLQCMGYQSLYFGLPPALVPGPYAMIPYTEQMGIYYPCGGMIQIPTALLRVGKKFGLQIRYNSLVSKVIVRGHRAVGVQLEDGSEISASVIVSDINAKTLYLKLIGDEYLSMLSRKGIRSYAYSKAVPMLYLGVDFEPSLESHHNLIAATPEDINQYWWKYVETGQLDYETVGLVCWPTRTDPSLAPEGHHVLNIIPEGFYHLADENWDSIKDAFIEKEIDYYSKFAIPGLKDHVRFAECATPLDFERQLQLPEGSIYALQQDITAQAIFRPAARSKNIHGLYLVGASTHPGGGVPSTIASGLIASTLIQTFED
ncbi:MAG: NAD(P)/FAD-dependent oxidoreductase [Chloroflexi bacterium]|nr:NAD(P)/FAD-dependent oxidoreductase [Chloroflexota bacterium]